jgi:SAM-dependent methyltransferase
MTAADSDIDLSLAEHEQVSLWSEITRYLGYGRSSIYDFCIVHVTGTWYEAMLEELDEGAVVLDVGCGTASKCQLVSFGSRRGIFMAQDIIMICCCSPAALVMHRAILQRKNIRVIGIDNDEAYIEAAKFHIGEASIENCIRVYCQDVYTMLELDGQIVLPHGNQVGFHSQNDNVKFDAILFSGSFAVLPKKTEALQMLLDDWGNPDTCKVMIAQAYQRAITPLARVFKPLLKYLTTVDHGDLITEDEASKMIAKITNTCHMKLLSHEVIHGSIDNALEAAYMTVLERNKK